MAVGRDVGDEFFDDLEPDLGVGVFAAAKFQRDLHLHVFAKKINGVRGLDAEIMRINARTQLDFLHDRGVLVLAGIFFLLGEFVAELAEVHEPADGRHGVGRNLDEIHGVLPREVDRVGELDDAELLVIHADDADFAGTDFSVDADERRGGGIARGIRAAQATLTGWD